MSILYNPFTYKSFLVWSFSSYFKYLGCGTVFDIKIGMRYFCLVLLILNFCYAEPAYIPNKSLTPPENQKDEGVLLKKMYESAVSFSEEGFSEFRFSRERPYSDEVDVQLNEDRGNGKINLRLDLLTVADKNPFTQKMPFLNEEGIRLNYINSGDAEFGQLGIIRNHREDFDLGLLKCRFTAGFDVEFRGGGNDPYQKSVGLRGNLETQVGMDLRYLNVMLKAKYTPELTEPIFTGRTDSQWHVGAGVEIPLHESAALNIDFEKYSNDLIPSLDEQGNRLAFGLSIKF